MKATETTTAYIIGGGIAGLAAAVYLITDANIAAERILVLEESEVFGGSLDASGDAHSGYLMRGGRMFEERYVCTYDLLSHIPSTDNPNVSASDDIRNFTREAGWDATARLMDGAGHIIDASSMGFDGGDRWALFSLLFLTSEASLGEKRIDQVFPPHFFASNFWLMWCTMFSFQPWHSAVEMRRYLLRFIHLFPQIADLSCVYHTRYNQYHSIVLPTRSWLQSRGVQFQSGARVLDIEFRQEGKGFRAANLKLRKDGVERTLSLAASDLVLFTNGSMTAASTYGSMTTPAVLDRAKQGASWDLWKTLAAKRPAFGRPEKFTADIEKSKWLSYTVTVREPLLRQLVEGLTKRTWGREGLITFKDSGWFMTVHPHYRPAYPGQPDNIDIFWGYGLNPDAEGDFVKKPMAACTGEELLRETYSQLRLERHMEELVASSTAIPCMMPYITSQFMPRVAGDRPDVVPAGSENFAFLGQFAEAPEDVVFTVEYSVRTARMAVQKLLDLDVAIPPVYKGQYNPLVLLAAARESFS